MIGCSESSSTTLPGTGGGGGNGGTGGDAPLLDEYVLSDDMLVPESGSFDPTGRSFYVGSATDGSVTKIDADGTESLFFPAPTAEAWRTLGMIVDDAARRLWVCAQRTDDDSQWIWAFDLSTGDRELELDLADAAAGSTCNDIALDGDGLAYVSDSENPRVYRADATAESVVVWADDEVLSPTAQGNFGGNGIAVTEDDRYVIVSKTSEGAPPRLLRIALDDPSSITELVPTPALEGFADGMSFLDGDLYIAMVGVGNVVRLTSTDDWATASLVTVAAGATGPVPGTSTVRPVEGSLYAIYSDITAFLLNVDLSPPFRIYKVDLASFE
jgi:sugar lactone lactonase YvrE